MKKIILIRIRKDRGSIDRLIYIYTYIDIHRYTFIPNQKHPRLNREKENIYTHTYIHIYIYIIYYSFLLLLFR